MTTKSKKFKSVSSMVKKIASKKFYRKFMKSKKKVRPIRAWAVFFRGRSYWLGREGHGHALVYDTKFSAELRANAAPQFEVREVEITPINRKKIK